MRALIAGAVAVALALLPAPATAEEDQISGRPAVSGSFLGAERGFFLCFETDLSPTGTPDCVLGYVVPSGDEGAGLELFAVGRDARDVGAAHSGSITAAHRHPHWAHSPDSRSPGASWLSDRRRCPLWRRAQP